MNDGYRNVCHYCKGPNNGSDTGLCKRCAAVREAMAMPLGELAEMVVRKSYTAGCHDTMLIERCRVVADVERELQYEKKLCGNCTFLRKYTADNGAWLNVCEAKEPDCEDDGLYKVYVVDTVIFDASLCLHFVMK